MQTTELPYTLVEPSSYPVLGDLIDVHMLMKLERDATTSLSDIARELGISRQLAQFHYKEHLLRKKLIEGYEIFAMRYGDAPYVMAFFRISFHSYETYAKFAKSLLNKPFVITMGKTLGENGLLLEVFLPTIEFRNFIDTLSMMARMKLVQHYGYTLQDLRIMSRQTISGEFFGGKSWTYNHNGHVEALRQKVAEDQQASKPSLSG